MAGRTTTQFQTLYGSTGSQFPDNNTGLITEIVMRTFGQDLSDSYINRFSQFQGLTSATGTNGYAITSAITAHASGFLALVKFPNASTGAATLNPNAIGAKKIMKSPSIQAGNGDIVQNGSYLLVYDSALDGGSGAYLMLGGVDSVEEGGPWNFAGNSDDFPTSVKAGTVWFAEDDHGSSGDADYVPAGAWMLSKISGADEFSDYSIRI